MNLTKSKLKEIIREELNELKPGQSSYREYKKVHKMLDNIRDELSTLIKYGEDYSLFQDAKYAAKTLKKVWRDIGRIT
jgi:lipopolysaccharide/colanic/teichoic acid biosynthesis glycosyltransferase|tara:strand:- start:110 stop:343 length:234 start_codon:yes stop_codon:yes gene_type:complete